MERIDVGQKHFGGKIDITDPCYDKRTWCRINGVSIVEGTYNCYVVMAYDHETGGWGTRIAEIGIELDGVKVISGYQKIGEIGVDAGLAGFFENKPDYTDDEWGEFCKKIHGYDKYWLWDVGFFSESGYGDGGYRVEAVKDENENVIALRIVFLTEADFADEDDADFADEVTDDSVEEYDELDDE